MDSFDIVTHRNCGGFVITFIIVVLVVVIILSSVWCTVLSMKSIMDRVWIGLGLLL